MKDCSLAPAPLKGHFPHNLFEEGFGPRIHLSSLCLQDLLLVPYINWLLERGKTLEPLSSVM